VRQTPSASQSQSQKHSQIETSSPSGERNAGCWRQLKAATGENGGVSLPGEGNLWSSILDSVKTTKAVQSQKHSQIETSSPSGERNAGCWRQLQTFRCCLLSVRQQRPRSHRPVHRQRQQRERMAASPCRARATCGARWPTGAVLACYVAEHAPVLTDFGGAGRLTEYDALLPAGAPRAGKSSLVSRLGTSDGHLPPHLEPDNQGYTTRWGRVQKPDSEGAN
jgi:hypothetical protein